MESAGVLATSADPKVCCDECVPVAALASGVAFAAATSLLVWSLFSGRKGKSTVAGQVSLGVLAGCAAAVVWHQRQEELTAARNFVSHIGEVRDARWLKKHPIAYG